MPASASQLGPLVDRLNLKLLELQTQVDALRRQAAEKGFAYYTQSSGQSFANGTPTIINFATKVSDADNAVSVGAGWQFACPTGKGGLYLVCAAAGGNASNPVTDAMLQVFVGGVETLRGTRINRSAAGFIDLTVAGVLSLNAGDVVQVKLYQTQSPTAALALEANGATNWVTIARIPGG